MIIQDKIKGKRYLYVVRSTSKSVPKTISVLADDEAEAYESVLNVIKEMTKDEVLEPIILNLESITTRVMTKEIEEEYTIIDDGAVITE